MDRDHLNRLMAFSCPIPQYEQTRKKLEHFIVNGRPSLVSGKPDANCGQRTQNPKH